MASIGEQIITARKAKGMTQDALAKALNISRATISNYEGNRRLPDAETLLRLSAALDYSFEDEAAKASPREVKREAESTDSPGEANADAAQTDAHASARKAATPSNKRRRIVVCAAAAVALCAALLLVFTQKGKPQSVPPTSANVNADTVTKAFFQQDNINNEGQPFFNIDSTLTTQKNDGMDMWLYTLTFHEMNGHPFSIDRLEAYTFFVDRVHTVELTRDTIAAQGLAVDISAHGDWSMDGGMPIQDSVVGIGFVLRGKDEAGAALSFVFYQPLASK